MPSMFNKANTNDKQLSRHDMLASFLNDDELNDVTLQGSDGVHVPANRFILSARSTVFRSMLLGRFQESSSSVVELGFPGSILKAIVEYILTDQTTMTNMDDTSIQSLVSLAEAASYFDIPGIGTVLAGIFKKKVKAQPSSSFAILQECRAAGPSVPDDLVEQALTFVRKTPFDEIHRKDCSFLSADVLEEILKDTDLEMTEYELFQILEYWAQGTNSSRRDEDEEDRQNTAQRLAKHICLIKIHPDYLFRTVASSGFFTLEEVSEAYESQSLMEKEARAPLDLFAPRKLKWTTVIAGNSEPLCKIMIEGAGTKEVNGVYVQCGIFQGNPKYSMRGTYGGKPCVFSLFSPHGSGNWYLSILDHYKPGSARDIDFYRVYCRERHKIPPVEGWFSDRSDNGIGPSPKLLYNFRTSGII